MLCNYCGHKCAVFKKTDKRWKIKCINLIFYFVKLNNALFQYQRWSFLLGLVLYYLLLRTIWFIGLTKQLQSNVHLNHFRGQGWLLKLDYVHFKLIMHCASPYNSFWIQKPCLKYIFNMVASSIFSVNRNILCATGLAWIIAAYA